LNAPDRSSDELELTEVRLAIGPVKVAGAVKQWRLNFRIMSCAAAPANPMRSCPASYAELQPALQTQFRGEEPNAGGLDSFSAA